jgi:uncharacterized membrane protein YhaH (DUF805 family)
MSPKYQTNLIRWQSRGRRKPQLAGALISLLVVPAVTGVAMIWAQQTGRLHLPPEWSLLPLGLILLAVSVQAIALVRSVVKWLLVT